MAARLTPVKPPGATRRAAAKVRPGAPYLDRRTLVRVAADVADRDGWSNLTLSEVAKEVDRHVTSLYAHVDSLEALRREVALLALDELSEAVWTAALGRTREEALTAIAEVYRGFARGHPGRISALLTVHHGTDDEVAARGRRLAEPIRATFRSFGLDDRQITHAHSVFSSAVRGLAMAEQTATFAFEDLDETFRQLISLFAVALSTGRWPGRPTSSART